MKYVMKYFSEVIDFPGVGVIFEKKQVAGHYKTSIEEVKMG